MVAGRRAGPGGRRGFVPVAATSGYRQCGCGSRCGVRSRPSIVCSAGRGGPARRLTSVV